MIIYKCMYIHMILYMLDFPGGSDGKASAYNAGDPGSISGLGISSGEGKWQPTPILLPEKSHGRRNVVSYSPWGHKELDTTEQFHFTYICLYTCDFGPNTTNERSKRC